MIINSLSERAKQLRAKKKGLVDKGQYPMDFVLSVLSTMSGYSEGLDRSSVDKAIRARRDGLENLRVEQERFCGRHLNFVGMEDLLSLVEFYRKRGKIGQYTGESVRSVVEMVRQKYC